MRRHEFARVFLEALGAERVVVDAVAEDFVEGEAHYRDRETQRFRWNAREEEVPCDNALLLLRLLRDDGLLAIDRITMPRNDLWMHYQRRCGRAVSRDEFLRLLEAVELVEIAMIDNGHETDRFFIHE